MDEIKSNFDMAINMIESGEAERSIIEAENNGNRSTISGTS